MNKFIYSASTCLVIFTNLIAFPAGSQLPTSPKPVTNAPSGTNAPSPKPEVITPAGNNILTKFECRNRTSSTGEILLRANGYYTAQSESGKYQVSDRGYQFLSGALRDRTIVRSKQSSYLIGTNDRTKASSISEIENALSCTGGNVYR
jgi:hypothetical protein